MKKKLIRAILSAFLLLWPPTARTGASEVNPVPSYDDWVKDTKLLFISDSLLMGTSDHLKTLAPNADLNAETNRVLYQMESESDGPRDAMSVASNTYAPIVFVAMGLDQPVSMEQVNRFIDGLLEEGDKVTNIVFITSGSNSENKNTYNSNMSNIASQNQHVYIIDWDELASEKGYNNLYEKNGKYLLYPDQYYQYVLEETYEQMVSNMPLVTNESSIEIPIPELTKFDPNMKDGSSRILERGEAGTKVIKMTYNTFMGMPVGSPVVEETVLKEPKPTVTVVGLGVETKEVVEEVKTLPFETIYQENEFLDKGTTRIIQPGSPGTLSIKKTTTMIDNQAQGDPVVEEKVISEPTDEIVEVGTGVKEVRETEEFEEIPFEVQRIEDDLLLIGDEVVAQEGIVGQKKITTKTPFFNGQVSGDSVVTEKVIKEPQAKIIRVGTATEEDALYDASGEREEPKPFPWGIVVGLASLVAVGLGGMHLYSKFNKKE